MYQGGAGVGGSYEAPLWRIKSLGLLICEIPARLPQANHSCHSCRTESIERHAVCDPRTAVRDDDLFAGRALPATVLEDDTDRLSNGRSDCEVEVSSLCRTCTAPKFFMLQDDARNYQLR